MVRGAEGLLPAVMLSVVCAFVNLSNACLLICFPTSGQGLRLAVIQMARW